MNDIISYFIPVLGVISVLTSLVVEAIKKLLDEKKIKYSANILACIVSAILSLAYCIGYVIINQVTITPTIVCYGVVLVFFAWLISMVGYDKVIQLIKQIGE